MFIRNDISGEKKYFNGKLGEISAVDENEIKVVLEGSEREIVVKREVWEQKNIFWILIKPSRKKCWEVSSSFL